MLRLAPLAFLEGVKCKCWNEVVDFLAITLLIRGYSSLASNLEISLRSRRKKNALARIIGETPTT